MKDIKKRILLRMSAVKFWQLLLYICVVLVLILFITELSLDLDEKTLQIIGITDVFIWFVFVSDLSYHYITAEDKKVFFRQHWILILSLIPLTSLLKSLRSVQSLKATKLFEFGAKAENMAKAAKLGELETRLGAAYSTGILTSINPGIRTIKRTQMVAHWKHERFFTRPTDIKIYNYLGPGANKGVANGILEGIDLFVRKKLRLKPRYKELKNFDEIKNKRDNYLDVFITKNAIPKSTFNDEKYFGGTIVFATDNLADARNYKDKKANLIYLKKLRGTVSAYNELAKLFNYEACNNVHCAFNFNKEDLDTLTFLYHLNKEIPLCEKHGRWRY